MRTLFHRVAISAGIVLIVGACFLEQFVPRQVTVTAVFTGRSCQISLDNIDVTDHAKLLRFAVDPKLHSIGVPGLAPGHTGKLIYCGDLSIVVEGPIDSLPARGIYRVVKSGTAAPLPGVANVGLSGNSSNVSRPERRWPASMLDQDVDGISGTVQLDRVTKDSLLGRVEMVGRSHIKYP